MNPGVRSALSHGPSDGARQEWLFPTEGHSQPHSQTPGTGRCMWGDSLLQKLNRECRKNSVFIQTRQKFSAFSLVKILKQYFVWALSQVNVPACTSSHPASHFFWLTTKLTNQQKTTGIHMMLSNILGDPSPFLRCHNLNFSNCLP